MLVSRARRQLRGKRLLLHAALWLTLSLALSSHERLTTEITWSREVSRILDRRCFSCHHEGGAAFDLTSYRKARPWAKAIKEEVLQRRMPPWGAVKGFAVYRNDNSLTQEEMNVLAEWVEGGSPEGQRAELPVFTWDRVTSAPIPKVTGEIAIRSNLTRLEKLQSVAGIRPLALKDDAALWVIARRPNGTIEPLIWLYRYQSVFRHDYYFRRPLRLPAGTQIQMNTGEHGIVALLMSDSASEIDLLVPEQRHQHATQLGRVTAPDAGPASSPVDTRLGRWATASAGQDSGQYVCPMDPDVRSSRPGKCPRCGMDLTLGTPERIEFQMNLHSEPKTIRPGRRVELSFDIRNPRAAERVDRFKIIHEKLFHMFVVSQDLNYFLHQHPVLSPDGTFRFVAQFPKSGLYRVLTDFYPEGGVPQSVVNSLMVSRTLDDVNLVSRKLDADLNVKTTTNLTVKIAPEPRQPIAGMKTQILFQVQPAEGLEQYLGAWGHMLAASDDLVDMIHSHPFLVAENGRIQFNMIFPRARTYRLWVQFQKDSVVNTARFDIPVQELK